MQDKEFLAFAIEQYREVFATTEALFARASIAITAGTAVGAGCFVLLTRDKAHLASWGEYASLVHDGTTGLSIGLLVVGLGLLSRSLWMCSHESLPPVKKFAEWRTESRAHFVANAQESSIDPDEVSSEHVVRGLLQNVVNAEAKNRSILNKRLRYLRWSVNCVIVSAMLLAIAAVMSATAAALGRESIDGRSPLQPTQEPASASTPASTE